MIKTPFNLSSKVAIITGGASGIGKSIAEIFAQQGAIVIILDINGENAKAVVESITKRNQQVFFRACDIT
ncbi:MAG: SDR family NAD(P)-dependent oxidoreductase, partial [Bacteroidota bacterium]